jgi:hypothetical protein
VTRHRASQRNGYKEQTIMRANFEISAEVTRLVEHLLAHDSASYSRLAQSLVVMSNANTAMC